MHRSSIFSMPKSTTLIIRSGRKEEKRKEGGKGSVLRFR